jgi:hypothetical protein
VGRGGICLGFDPNLFEPFREVHFLRGKMVVVMMMMINPDMVVVNLYHREYGQRRRKNQLK